MSTTTEKTQPALVGGLVVGVLSALPIISAGNLCCCLWATSGGAVAAYVLQQNRPTPIAQGDGALVGLLAGLVGALVYLVVSIPIAFLIAPMERVLMERISSSGNMPPEFREWARTYVGGALGVAVGFAVMLVVGSIFSTLGGLLGAMFFRKEAPPAL